MHKKPAKNSLNAISTSIFLAVGSLLFSLPSPLLAQIEPDSTLGGESSQVVPVTPEADAITGGATRGSNLFHSFGTFNIDEGRAAYFVPDTEAIRTIFSRVTGGNPSQILGTLGVVGNANLFFINPAGILFGSNAKLDMSGSFIASTANSITFPDGQLFNATDPNAPPLLTIDVPVPIGLRFEGDEPREILNTGNLTTGENIALVGGAIGNAGQISAPGKDIVLSTVPTGVSSVINFDGTGKFIEQTQGVGQPNIEAADIFLIGGKLDASSTGIAGNVILNSAGNIALSDGALVDVRGAGGGSITVNAQNLEMSSGSQLLAGIGAGLGSSGAQAGNIEINVAEGVKLQGDTDTPITIGNAVNFASIGNAGEVIINTKTLEGIGGYSIGSATAGQGNAGRVSINAQETVSLEGLAEGTSGIASAVAPSAIGNGGDLIINARSLSLSNGAQLVTSTFGNGDAGNIQIQASESVSVSSGSVLQAITGSAGDAGDIIIKAEQGTISFDGANTIASTSVLQGSFGEIEFTGEGRGGNIIIESRDFTVTNGSRLAAGTNGKGASGNLTVNASESIQLSGVASGSDRGGLSTETEGEGKAGDIILNAQQLLVEKGAGVFTNTESKADGGSLTVNASDSVRLIGGDLNSGLDSSLASEASAQGNAGNLSINTRQLVVRDGALISTVATGEGNAGNLTVKATDSIQLSGISNDGSSISRLTTQTQGQGKAGDLSISTGELFIQNRAGISTSTIGQGNGGNLTINTKQFSIQDGALVLTTTTGSGDGGNLTVNASESIQAIGTSIVGIPSVLATGTIGTGDAGDLAINTGQLLVRDGARVAADSEGEGNGGDLTVNASESVQLIGTSEAGLLSSLTSQATGTGSAGRLTVNTRQLQIQNGAAISTTTANIGKGGDLTINASQFTQLNRGFLLAITLGKGKAGNLTVNTERLQMQNGAGISTTTLGEGNGGNLTIDAFNSIQLIGTSVTGFPSFLATGTTGKGDAGNLAINTGQLLVRDGARVAADSEGEGNGGDLTVNASESVQLIGTFNNLGGLSTQTDGIGKAGNLTITTGQLLVRDGAFVSTTTEGQEDGGNLTVNASDSVQLSGISLDDSSISRLTSLSSGAGKAGNISINTRQLLIQNGALITTTTQSEGNGGKLTINASESVQLIGTSTGGTFGSLLTGTTGQGNAGDLAIKTGQLLVRDGAAIATTTSGSGDAGNLDINTEQLLLRGGSAILTNTASEGDGGKISIHATDIVSLEEVSFIISGVLAEGQGNGGDINVRAGNFSMTNGSLLLASTTGQGNAGNINFDIDKTVTISGIGSRTINNVSITIPSIIASQVETGGAGNGGDISIRAESLFMSDFGFINTGTSGQGNAGNISIEVDDFVRLNNGSVVQSNVEAGGVGQGGNINIQARSLTLRGGGEIQAGLRAANENSPGGIGAGGNININASNFVEISGVSPVSAQFSVINPTTSEELFLNKGISSGIFGSTQQGANGSAGNIIISTGAFRLADGAVVEAQTANQGNAGNITINANAFEVTGGGQVITATRSSGKAGSIILNVADKIALSGSDPNFEQRLELLQGNTAQFTNISPSSGLFANTTEGSSGNGGSIFIDPRTVTISDGAIVSVNSQGSGIGGEIDLTAGSLSLDEGTISAQTDSTTGGNIALNVENVLLLRNGSQISTTAGTGQAGGDGGNIIINAGAIIANPLENSDITANAFLGRGGNILINTESIFGIDFRQRLTPLSDITASSEAGLAGTVEINTSGIDPTRGLEALTEERINAEVAQGCQAGAQGEGTLSFFNLGRGGTPPSPDDLFNSPMTGEWLSLELEENPKNEPQSHLESQIQQASHNTVWLTCPSQRARSLHRK